MRRLLAGSAAGLALLAAAGSAAAGEPADVTVRVEGVERTLVPRTDVRTTREAVSKDGRHACPGTSAAGALERVTRGDWAGTWYDGLGYSVDRIRSEAWPFGNPQNRFWAFWLNERMAETGVCGVELEAGDRVLFFVDCFGEGCVSPKPLSVKAPPRVRVGAEFAVQALRHAGDGTSSPAPDVVILGGGGSVRTDASGNARLRLRPAGEHGLQATGEGHVRSSIRRVCATDGDDGFCGTEDDDPPVTRIRGIDEGERFRRGRAPRLLRGRVNADPSGLETVKLRLRHGYRGRCHYFSGRRERLRRTRCGRAFWFAIGDRRSWSYLLPRDLPPGRYVLDAKAVDGAGNRETRLRRGRNRIVFHVGRR